MSILYPYFFYLVLDSEKQKKQIQKHMAKNTLAQLLRRTLIET